MLTHQDSAAVLSKWVYKQTPECYAKHGKPWWINVSMLTHKDSAAVVSKWIYKQIPESYAKHGKPW